MAKFKFPALLSRAAIVAGLSMLPMVASWAEDADENGLYFSEAQARVEQIKNDHELTNREQMIKQIREIEAGLTLLFQGDYAGAVKEFRTSALNGNPAAQNSLAIMYEKGMGVEVDYAEAQNWYQVAVDHGSFDALYNLAVLYAEGPYGVPQDLHRALELFDQACTGGDEGACEYAAELRSNMNG